MAERSGVPAPTIRRFEKYGEISFSSLIKLIIAVGWLDKVGSFLVTNFEEMQSLDEALRIEEKTEASLGKHRRGRL